MIEICYKPESFCVTVKGHAGTAPKGQDLVCAAASCLVLTLAEDVRKLEEIGAVHSCSIRLEEGDAEIRCEPVSNMRSTIRIIYESVLPGFGVLEQLHKDAVSFLIV